MSKEWLDTTEAKLKSLIADEAKTQAILLSLESTIRQLKAKNQFQLSLMNQLLEEHINNIVNK